MAYLILNEREPYANETDEFEKYYEFDPKDKTAIDRIHKILTLRNRGISINSEKLLSDICENTLEIAAANARKSFISRLFETAKKHLSYQKRNNSKKSKNSLSNLNAYTCHLCKANIS
jgi:DNA-binding transcriptional MerR regulator